VRHPSRVARAAKGRQEREDAQGQGSREWLLPMGRSVQTFVETVRDLNRDAPGTTPTSRWLTPRAPSDRIDTVTMPRGREKVLWDTVPRGKMKARVFPAAPPNVVLITLVQLPVY